jgi:hypothetical protein
MIWDCHIMPSCGWLRKASDAEIYCRKRTPNLCQLRVANRPNKWKNALIYWGICGLWSIDRLLRSLVFRDTLPTGPRGVLEQVTYVFAGLQYEPCVPPVLFALQIILPGEAPIMNLSYSLGGCNAVWDALTKLTVYFSAGSVQYAVQPYYNIGIPSFRRFVPFDAFLMVIFHSISWSR